MSEREMVKVGKKEMLLLKDILEIKGNKCFYCKSVVKPGKFSLFNKPTRIICDSILCMAEALEEDEAEQ